MLKSLLKYYPILLSSSLIISNLSDAKGGNKLHLDYIAISILQSSFFTKSNIRMKYFAKLSLLCAAFLLMASAAMAQFTANGTVTDDSGEPLIGATVLVKGTAIGTVTDFDGNYTLSVPSSPATLIISYTGYAGTEVEVSSGNPTANLSLASDVANLDEVVVTGFASSVKRKNLANAVASIGSEELTGVTSQATMEGSLYGKFTGAEIRSNSGAPGGGMSVRLRGVTSIFGDQQPLYIVDGVYMDNKTISSGTNIVSAAAGGGNSASNQDDASNRIADLDPEDIENIEILKGASAAAIYGSRAAGGVVLITTKKGKAGETNVNFSQTIGTVSAIRLLGTRDWTSERVEGAYGPDAAAAFNAGQFTDYESELYGGSALQSTSRLELLGGTAKTNFFIGGTFSDNDGIVNNTGYKKSSIRMNIGHKLSDWLKVDVTTNYIDSQSDRGFFNNSNTNATVGYALAFTTPWEQLQADKDGVYPAGGAGSNVLETVNLITNREDINRFLGGVTATFDIMQTDNSSLRLVARGGLDQYTLRTTAIFPQALSYYRSPETLGGVSVSGSSVNQNTNLSAFLVHSLYTDSGLSFTTQVGVTQEDFLLNTVTTTATGLNGSQTNVDQAANFLTSQFILPQQDKGFFAQEEINFDDKVIATVGIRADKSSNNGDANQLYFYPKANVAVNLAEFDGLNDGIFNQLKVRAAYGEAGRFANFADRFNLYNATAIGGRSGLRSSTLLGNSGVGPERQTELEFGLDAAILDNRVGLSATYYIKGVDDLLMQQRLPTSSGYTARVLNVGSLENKGIELELNINPVRSEGFNWTTDFRWWKNNSEITRLDIPAFNLGGFAASLGQYRIEEGSSATQIVGSYNSADCETADCSDLDPNGDGFRVYGDAEPDFNLSWWNGFKVGKNLDVNFLFHWKQGSEGVNLSTLLYDLGNTTWDFDDTTLDPSGEQGNGTYRTSQWRSGNAGPWIEDSSYIRLREIGAYYTIPRSSLGDIASLKLGVSGRNLINIFDYNSYDPEVSNFGGNVLANAIEVTPFPSSKSVNFHLKLSF